MPDAAPTFRAHRTDPTNHRDRRSKIADIIQAQTPPHFQVTVRATVSAPSLSLCLDFLRMFARLKLEEEHPRLWRDGLRTWADESLCAVYSKVRKAGLGVEVFWATHSFAASLLISSAYVSEVLACKTKWLDVSTPLMAICSGSKLGTRMFGFAMAMVSAERIAAYAIDLLKGFGDKLTEETEADFFTKVMAEVTRLDISVALAERRQIKLSYRGLTLSMQTQTAEDISLRWGCFVREVGKSIPRLPFEDDVCGPLDKPQELSPEIAKTVRIARDTLLQLLTEHPHSSFSEVCARKGDIVVQCDPGAKVDLAIGEALIGSGGEELIVQHIMK